MQPALFSPQSPVLGGGGMATVLVLAASSGDGLRRLHAALGRKRVLDWTLDTVRASGLLFHVADLEPDQLGESIAAAVRATPQAAGWLVLPAGYALVSARSLLAVARALRRAPMVTSYHQGQRGYPLGLGPEQAEAAQHLHGRYSLERWVAAHESMRRAERLELNDPGCVTDVLSDAGLQLAQTQLAS